MQVKWYTLLSLGFIMIKLDRSSTIPISDQLVEQLRYHIASGIYKINDNLPPTRKLASQLNVSFHTVRKAYLKLVQEGILAAEKGSGYRVLARAPLTSEERLEQGATIVEEALQRLVGIGLEETDIDYLFQEQLALMDSATQDSKVVFVAPYLEIGEQFSHYISSILQINVEYSTLNNLEIKHQDADYILCRHADIQTVVEIFPRVDVLGLTLYLSPETLDRIAHLYTRETLGLITYNKESIPHLMTEIQITTGFSGQIFGASLEDGSSHLKQFIDQTDLVVFTPRCKRALHTFSKQEKTFTQIGHIVSQESIQAIQRLLPGL